MYRKADSSEKCSDNLFDINAKQAVEEKEGILSDGCSQDIIDRIVDELLSQTVVWKFDGKRVNGTLDTKSLPETEVKVLKEELLKISKDVRPQFTGTFVAKDMKESSSEIVYLMLQKYMGRLYFLPWWLKWYSSGLLIHHLGVKSGFGVRLPATALIFIIIFQTFRITSGRLFLSY